jgi:hypothetical protein
VGRTLSAHRPPVYWPPISPGAAIPTTLRARLLPGSTKIRLPAVSIVMPAANQSRAAVAGPPSPENPILARADDGGDASVGIDLAHPVVEQIADIEVAGGVQGQVLRGAPPTGEALPRWAC